MKSKAPQTLILGSGPVAAALSLILCEKQVQRLADDSGWAWPTTKKRSSDKIEGIRLVLVAGPNTGISQWIRWHRDARECPLARRVGCMLFGMPPSFASKLSRHDVFGRLVGDCASFGDWGADLLLLDGSRTLAVIISELAGLETLPESSWLSSLKAASCLPSLIEAIKNRSMADLSRYLESANVTDWDTMCFSGTQFGNSHAWAHFINSWLAGVTAGVTPDWENGLALFTPLLARQSLT
jgi:hypothetical protein